MAKTNDAGASATVKSARTVKPAKSAKTVKPAKSAKTVKPAKSARSVKPAKTVEATNTVEPATLDTESIPNSVPLTPKISAVIERFRPDAEALTELARYHGGTRAVVVNVQAGVDNARDDLVRIASIAEVPLEEFESLPALARAVHYADLLVNGAIDDGRTDKPYFELLRMRGKAIDTASLAARGGFVDPAELQDIRKGKGKEDTIDDALRLDRLFEGKHHLLVGPLVMSPAEFAEMAELAHDMQGDAVDTPITVARRAQKPTYPAILLRQQLYSLLLRRYTRFRDTAIAVYGSREINNIIPFLHSTLRTPPVSDADLLPEIETEPDTTAPAST